MKRPLKIVIWIVAVMIILLVLATAATALFFPKEKARAMAIDKISTALGRKVTIDGISLSIWGGLGVYLEGVKISNPVGFGGPDFVRAKALDVKLSLLPLLRREIKISRLILVQPEVNLHKLATGQSNYRFVGATPAATGPGAPAAVPEESKLAAIAITFDNLSIKDGRLLYADDSSGMKMNADGLSLKSRVEAPRSMAFHTMGEIAVDSLKVVTAKSRIPDLKLKAQYDATIDLKANTIVLADSKIDVNGLTFDVKAGVPNLQTMNFINAQITTDRTDLKSLLTLLPDSFKPLVAPYRADGKLTLNATVKYSKGGYPSVIYDGKAGLEDLKLSKQGIKGELLINSAAADFKNDYFKFVIEKGSFDNNPLEGFLAVSNFARPVIEGKFKGKLDLAFLNAFLPKAGNPDISGEAEFDLNARGAIKELSQLQVTGTLAVTDGKYSATTLPEPVESFNADIRFNPDNMVINRLQVKFPSSDMALTGTMQDPFPYLIPGQSSGAVKPNLSFKLQSHRFDTDKLFPEAVPGSGVNPTKVPLDSLPPIFLPDIDGSGVGQIDTLIYSRVQFTKITGDIAIKDRKIFVTDANGDVYTGKVTGQTEIDLNDFNNPKFTGKFDATQIEANDFLTRFAKFPDHFFGKLNMTGEFSASGWDPEPLLQSLSMDGLAVTKEAKIRNFDLIEKLAQTLNLKTFTEETLKDATTAFKVEDGRVVLDGFKFISSVGDWDVGGSIGFDGGLDYRGDVLLSEKVTSDLMARSDMASGFVGLLREGQTGRVRIPFKLGGSYSSPQFNLDLNAGKQVQENLKSKVNSALQDLLNKK